MDIQTILLILRVTSAGLLLLLIAGLFFAVWHDFRTTVKQVTASKRSHGYLVALREIDGTLALTGEIYPLMPLTTLGRAPTNTIRITDDYASADHAMVARRSGQWWLEDRKSRNGTTLNKTTIDRAVVITNGDVIGIGSTYFRVDLEN